MVLGCAADFVLNISFFFMVSMNLVKLHCLYLPMIE